MEQQDLTPFGRRTVERLRTLKRDDDWLLENLRQRGIYMSKERYIEIITGQVMSKQQELSIGRLLTDEEKIQELAKKVGIKRGN